MKTKLNEYMRLLDKFMYGFYATQVTFTLKKSILWPGLQYIVIHFICRPTVCKQSKAILYVPNILDTLGI